MIERPTETEKMLERLAGSLKGWVEFLFRVFMGVLSIPITVLSLFGLYAYKSLLWLHWSGEESITAIGERFNGRRKT
jgi:hypothetical protein